MLLRLPSEGYPTDTQKSPIGFEIFNPAPAGGVSSTAADMGRFGQALLNGGELDGHRILKPETVAAMWTPQFRASDQLPPIGMGFYQVWRNNLRWIGHEGDLVAFHSLFMLEPSQKLLLFISYNSAGGGERTRPEIIDMFTDRYFPGQTGQSFVAFPRRELKDIEGVYQSTRRGESGKVKLLSLLSQRVATVDKEGVLHIEDIKDLRHHLVKWKPIGKDLWQEMDGQRRVFAIRDQGDQVVRLAYDFPRGASTASSLVRASRTGVVSGRRQPGGADTGGSCSAHPVGQEIDSESPAPSGASAGNSLVATDDASGGRTMGGAAGYPWHFCCCAWRRRHHASHLGLG